MGFRVQKYYGFQMDKNNLFYPKVKVPIPLWFAWFLQVENVVPIPIPNSFCMSNPWRSVLIAQHIFGLFSLVNIQSSFSCSRHQQLYVKVLRMDLFQTFLHNLRAFCLFNLWVRKLWNGRPVELMRLLSSHHSDVFMSGVYPPLFLRQRYVTHHENKNT